MAQAAWVRSLVRELISSTPHDLAKKRDRELIRGTTGRGESENKSEAVLTKASCSVKLSLRLTFKMDKDIV